MVDGYQGVAMDTHIYQMFSDEVRTFYSVTYHTNDMSSKSPTTIPSTSMRRAAMDLTSPASTCGYLLVNGPLHPQTARNG